MNSTLQDYQVLNIVGSGSFGTCYKVRNVLTDEIFVWKAVDYGRMSEEKKKLLCNEVNMLSEISHPYIVKYFSRILHKETTTLYIIMEWCQGGDLASVIKETYKLGKLIEEWYIWRVIYQMARALEHLHQEYALAHRDVKAANVFLDSRGNVKLGDFGLSCTVSLNHSSPHSITVGTLHYVSPEILKGSQYTFKSDIWSFGCLVYEMCSLSPPFHGVSMAQIISNIKAGRCHRIPTNYSESLIKLVESMLTVELELRPSARVITRHPAVVANQVSSTADFSSSSSSASLTNKSEASSSGLDMTKKLAAVKISEDPEDISKKIFKDKWLAKLESVRSREARLREKADKLHEREHSLDRREKRLALLERQAKEKFDRAQVYLSRCKDTKSQQAQSALNDSYASISPKEANLPPTFAKLDPLSLFKPNFRSSTRGKHVHFQNQNENRPVQNLHRNSTELSFFHLSNTGPDVDRRTTIKGLSYSSCQIVKPGKENKTPGQAIKRNSVSRLSLRSSNIII